MGHFFVSYKHEDVAFVDELEEQLNRQGILTWTDRKIVAGDEW